VIVDTYQKRFVVMIVVNIVADVAVSVCGEDGRIWGDACLDHDCFFGRN
jgi:hypothetical protein